VRFYCLDDNKDFYADFKWGTRVLCDVGPHDLGKRFPDEPFWEHCCHCEATWVAKDHGTSPRAICPGCKRKLEIAYLCHVCETFGLREAESLDPNQDRASGGAICGTCSADLNSLRWHYCVSLDMSFLSKRDQCPLCDASFFPIAAQTLLSSVKGHSYRLARISEVDVEDLLLVPTTSDRPDEIQFFVLGGARGAIVVPRYTTRSMIEERARKYQQVFDWSNEWTGDILIERPAIFELAGKGWKLKKHGKLAGEITTEQEGAQSQSEISEYSDGSPSLKMADRENQLSLEQSSKSVGLKPISNLGVFPSFRNPESSGESNTSEQITAADSQAQPKAASDQRSADPLRSKAQSLYRSLVAGAPLTSGPVYLDFRKSASKEGVRNTDEVLKEVSSQGSFVLIVSSENQGWVFPNPKLTFDPESLHPLFATLTSDQFDNFKEHIKPVSVTRVGKDGWRVQPADKDRSDLQSNSSVAIKPKTSEPAKSALVFPVSAADCLAKTESFSKVVRHDVVRNLLVTGPNGKGELALIHSSTVSKKGGSLFVVPRITRFTSSDTFSSLYKEYYDCARPSAGEVWIVKPAVVAKAPGGWHLTEKGKLGIDLVVNESPIQHVKPEKIKIELKKAGKIELEGGPQKSPAARPLVEWRLRLAIGVIASVILIAAVLISIRRGPESPVENRNASPNPTPTNMVRIPGGEFQMGNDTGDEYEKPAHKEVVKPFLMDANEVTCEEYLVFVNAKSHRPPSNWIGGQYPTGAAKKPVTGVDWDDATAYASWAKKRLPREEEWEFAARGTDGRRYPWGNEWHRDVANADGASRGLADVGTYKNGASLLKAYDMVGNAWEWTASPMVPYPGGHLPPQPAEELKVIRGGSWQSDRTSATTTYRWGWPARGGDYSNTGFRCVRDIPSASESNSPERR
jgi:formylglycine-generating enzyme required for sulfatase activity